MLTAASGCSAKEQITADDYLNALHALVVLAVDTHAVRAALRAAHDSRDELSRQRHQLRMAITAGQKELKEGAKAAAETDTTEGQKGAKKGAEKGRMPTRGKADDAKSKLEADREQLLVVDAELQAVQVRLSFPCGTCTFLPFSKGWNARLLRFCARIRGIYAPSGRVLQVKLTPYLGQDRQRNDFWCLHVAGEGAAVQHPVVLCQEYSHVCPPLPCYWCRQPQKYPRVCR